MSESIETRTVLQCLSHHRMLINRHGSINKILKNIRSKLSLTESTTAEQMISTNWQNNACI